MTHILHTLCTAAALLVLTGCNSITGPAGEYADNALTAREQFNADRLAAAQAEAVRPVIDLRLSHAAAAAIAQTAPERDADGNPVPAIHLTYTPRIEWPGYIEAPFWRLIPDGNALVGGFIAGYSIWSNHETANNRLAVDRELRLREADSNDLLIQGLLDQEPIILEPTILD